MHAHDPGQRIAPIVHPILINLAYLERAWLTLRAQEHSGSVTRRMLHRNIFLDYPTRSAIYLMMRCTMTAFLLRLEGRDGKD
jgi:hypothetical protein